jgi:hypothetical protein
VDQTEAEAWAGQSVEGYCAAKDLQRESGGEGEVSLAERAGEGGKEPYQARLRDRNSSSSSRGRCQQCSSSFSLSGGGEDNTRQDREAGQGRQGRAQVQLSDSLFCFL